MSALASLAGSVRLYPGRALPTIESSRPDAAARLAPGRLASELPTLLGNVFTLCSHAHRFTARRAVASALGQVDATSADDIRALQLATLRDQVLRIAHDWPTQLPTHSPDQSEQLDPMLHLRACPLWRQDLSAIDQLAALPQWLEHHWLGMPAADWLARHQADPEGWAARWCETSTSPVARLLHSQRAASQRLLTPARPLDVLSDSSTHMPMLARQMADVEGFCARPQWQGRVPDTGPWTRRADPATLPAHNAWMRFVSRLIDVLHLSGPHGAAWLSHGALPLHAGEGVAWTEMARGLLVHWVRLDPPLAGVSGASSASIDTARVAACRVLAPTEWNFHPRGVLAQSLAALAGPTRRFDARRLALAFDPCVAFDVVEPEGALHA